MSRNLVKQFGRVGLPLELTRSPIVSVGNTDIFQMDIRRGKRPGVGLYRIWEGHPENRLDVLGADRDEQQLVLFVHEPSRAFVQTSLVNIGKNPPLSRGDRVVGRESAARGMERVHVERNTPDTKRHYLVGMDEVDYFIAQLPRGVSSVRDAHHILKPSVVQNLRKGAEVIRQGEWFFIEPSKAQRAQLDEALANPLLHIYKKVPIGPFSDGSYLRTGRSGAVVQRVGNPHTADEILVIKGTVYVRGEVRHIDHNTLKLWDWRVVFRNAEAGLTGVSSWID